MAATKIFWSMMRRRSYARKARKRDECACVVSMDPDFETDLQKRLTDESTKHLEDITRHLRKQYMLERGRDARPSELRRLKKDARLFYCRIVKTLNARLEKRRSYHHQSFTIVSGE